MDRSDRCMHASELNTLTHPLYVRETYVYTRLPTIPEREKNKKKRKKGKKEERKKGRKKRERGHCFRYLSHY